MRIVLLSDRDRRAIYAAMNTMAERAEEAAEDEGEGRDGDALLAEANVYARLARRFGRKSERARYAAWRVRS